MIFLEWLIGFVIIFPIMMLLIKTGKITESLAECYNEDDVDDQIPAWMFIIFSSLFFPISIPMTIIYKLLSKFIKEQPKN